MNDHFNRRDIDSWTFRLMTDVLHNFFETYRLYALSLMENQNKYTGYTINVTSCRYSVDEGYHVKFDCESNDFYKDPNLGLIHIPRMSYEVNITQDIINAHMQYNHYWSQE